jgi:2-oxoglutarate ferredoxin oxidoreductase subunit delta
MAVQVIVDEMYCKGCGLCVSACPQKILILDNNRLTAKGYHPALCENPEECNACTQCATMCPDVAIKIVKE